MEGGARMEVPACLSFSSSAEWKAPKVFAGRPCPGPSLEHVETKERTCGTDCHFPLRGRAGQSRDRAGQDMPVSLLNF